ncbi:MAG TPA: M20/M25/M40 family metallo-hydrolase [Victivallales bacterium]|nr:M20/M25/M40 family metallo-hydrolase [Victivallales bacterium]
MNIDKKFINKILEESIKIQQIAAPTFHEKKRAEYVKQSFLESGLEDVSIDSANNVYSCRSGCNGEAILVSAHLDTVFPIETDLTVKNDNSRIYGPGILDNSIAVASLIGLQKILNKHNIALPGDLFIVANSCEEGLGDLKGIKKVMDKLKNKVSKVIVLEGGNSDMLTYKGVCSRRYKISVKSPGGHGWENFGRESAIHLLIKLGEKLTRLNLSKIPKTTFNIGIIEGGLSVNGIAENASMSLELRSDSQPALNDLIKQVENIFSSFASDNSTLSFEITGNRSSGELKPNDPLLIIAKKIYKDFCIEPDLAPASTDANLPLSLGIPSICIGLTNGDNVHTVNEYMETEPFYTGFRKFVQLILNLYNVK